MQSYFSQLEDCIRQVTACVVSHAAQGSELSLELKMPIQNMIRLCASLVDDAANLQMEYTRLSEELASAKHNQTSLEAEHADLLDGVRAEHAQLLEKEQTNTDLREALLVSERSLQSAQLAVVQEKAKSAELAAQLDHAVRLHRQVNAELCEQRELAMEFQACIRNLEHTIASDRQEYADTLAHLDPQRDPQPQGTMGWHNSSLDGQPGFLNSPLRAVPPAQASVHER